MVVADASLGRADITSSGAATRQHALTVAVCGAGAPGLRPFLFLALFTNSVEGVFSEVGVPLYRVLGTSPYSAPETRPHVLVINTAFGGCAALPYGGKLPL